MPTSHATSTPDSPPMLDLAIIGAGPAAFSAAIYAARAALKVKIFEKQHFGGTLTEIAQLDNYPGFSGSGQALADQLQTQAKQAGVALTYGTCTAIAQSSPSSSSHHFILSIDDSPAAARAVLIATGSQPRTLDLPTTTPVSYCALCDAQLYQGRDVLVIGGGNSAVGESAYLAPVVHHLTLINRSPLRAEPALVRRLRTHPNVTILENTTPTPELLNSVSGIFVFIGKQPATGFLPATILDSDGYVVTDFAYQTALPGLFAAGDVRASSIKQVITAAAEGTAAALRIIDYLKSQPRPTH